MDISDWERGQTLILRKAQKKQGETAAVDKFRAFVV